jgi:arylsulfatase A-like enzyme
MHTCPQRNRIGFEDIQLNEEGRRQGDLVKDDYDAWLEDHGLAHKAYTHGLGNNQYGVRLSPLPEEATTTGWTRDRALQFLERRDPERPFFLYVSFDKPHPPITPPAEFYELYRDVEFPSPSMGEWLDEKLPARFEHLRNANNWQWLRDHPLEIQQSLRGYAAMVTHIDSCIGTILGHLREMGELDDTWIAFTSDHGDQLFEHGNFAKGDYFPGSTNVPFILVPPKSWRSEHPDYTPGRVDTEHATGLADFMPTLLDIASVPEDARPRPENQAGESLLPLLTDSDARFRQYTFGNCNVVYGVTDARYTYMWFGDEDIEFLFDRDQDPHHCHDLLMDPAASREAERFRVALADYLSRNDDPHADPGRKHGRTPIPRDWKLEQGTAVNLWNNRGRH